MARPTIGIVHDAFLICGRVQWVQVSLLHRHRRRVQHLHSTSLSAKASPELRPPGPFCCSWVFLVAMHVLDGFLSSSGVFGRTSHLPMDPDAGGQGCVTFSPYDANQHWYTSDQALHFLLEAGEQMFDYSWWLTFLLSSLYSLSNKTSFLVKEKKREHEGAVTIIFLLSKDKVLFNLGWKNGIRLNALWKNYFV
jgi:hypothetical protein